MKAIICCAAEKIGCLPPRSQFIQCVIYCLMKYKQITKRILRKSHICREILFECFRMEYAAALFYSTNLIGPKVLFTL